MKILSAKQIYGADKFTIEKQEISSVDLMERAAMAIFNWLKPRLKNSKSKIHLFCGIGNNGGDGLALARHLLENKYDISVNVINYGEKRSEDFLVNLHRLKKLDFWPTYIDANLELPEINVNDIIIDAIFGIGLNRPPDGWLGELIRYINTVPAYTLSIDVPSGLFVDRPSNHLESIIKADYTLSFQVPKLVFFLPETASFVGQWELLDIGLDPEYIFKVDAAYEMMSKYEIMPMYRPRNRFSHKGDYGHTLLIGGSYGKIGAMILASKACLTTGAGLVTTFIPECGYVPMQVANPEVMVLTDSDDDVITQINAPFKPSVVCLGMGMDVDKKTVKAFEQFLKSNSAPLVLDADALNILAKQKDLLELLPKQTILTPHPGELKRLIGDWNDDFEKLEKVQEFSKKYHLIVVVKGANTIVCFNDKGYVNSSGNPGMATAGSGDVLAGMITGLVSQRYEPIQAAIFGVYLHGLAGDIVASNQGYEAVTAQKIIDCIGDAFIELFKRAEQNRPSEN